VMPARSRAEMLAPEPANWSHPAVASLRPDSTAAVTRKVPSAPAAIAPSAATMARRRRSLELSRARCGTGSSSRWGTARFRGISAQTTTASRGAKKNAARHPKWTTTAGTARPATRVELGIPACLMPNTVAARAGLVCWASAWLAAGLLMPYAMAPATSSPPSDQTSRARGPIRAASSAEQTTLTLIALCHPTFSTHLPSRGDTAAAVRKKAAVRAPKPSGPIPSSGPIWKNAAPARNTGRVESVTTRTASTSSRGWEVRVIRRIVRSSGLPVAACHHEPVISPSSDYDRDRAEELRRARRRASGLLLFATAVFASTFLMGDATWVGFLRSTSEAAMIGGVADWFAVTALFRHPFGIPIPHTAIIPRSKTGLARSLGEFVRHNFLEPSQLTERIRAADLPHRAGEWLSSGANADLVAGQIAAVVGAVAEGL